MNMGKLEHFTVTINNNPKLVYKPGQTVEGVIKIRLNEDIKIHGVKLNIKGKARTKWIEDNIYNNEVITRRGKEEYFNHEVYLLGSETDEIVFTKGEHVFPFKFALPSKLPSSFETNYGYIRYYVKASVRRTGFHANYKVVKPLTVLSEFDLNSDPEALEPAEGCFKKVKCCLCCATGPVTVIFRIDRKGYVPGETINLYAAIENNSDRIIYNTVVTMKMVTTLYGGVENNHSYHVSVDITTAEHGQIEPGGTDTWNRGKLVVPSVVPSYLTGCNIIDIRYELELTVDIEDKIFDIMVPLDVIIGNVPLHHRSLDTLMLSTTKRNSTIGQPGNITMGTEAEQLVISKQPKSTLKPVIPAVSYEESVLGSVEIQTMTAEEIEKTEYYTPMYMYYDYKTK